MKQKPILFDGESVRALLTCAKCGKLSAPFPCEHCGSTEFSKTQTRRLCNPQPPDDWEPYGDIRMLHKMRDGGYVEDCHGDPIEIGRGWCNWCGDWGIKPKYQEGELGWVRETWSHASKYWDVPPRDIPSDATIWYRADTPESPDWTMWRPSIFMPKWAARLWVEFGPNRPPERVGTISWDDACAEGWPGPHADCTEYEGAVEWFKFRWNGIHGKDAWDRNDWVWCYQFKRIGEPK